MGGRRKALLSAEQEAEFLAPWAEQAKEAGLLGLSPIRAALAQRLDRPVAASVVWRLLARHGWRKVAPDTRAPQERSRGATGVEKKLPETLAAALNRVDLRGRSVRLMFQDEARFGRMARPRRCWVPLPWRPVMLNGYERQFVYVYGAVSPLQGDLDWMLCGEMNAVRMGEFLGQVSRAHPDEFIVMVLDGASSHKAKDLGVPEDIRLVPLPAYAPELNPQEHVWDELREKEFPNRVFNHLDAVIAQLRTGCRAWLTIMTGCVA